MLGCLRVHPKYLRIWQYGTIGKIYIVMEYCEGGSKNFGKKEEFKENILTSFSENPGVSLSKYITKYSKAEEPWDSELVWLYGRFDKGIR